MNLPPDHKARELALDITQSHHVEAPAGSGKTMLLVARLIKLLSRVRHPHEILALTFTNKAASEMKTRIGALLQKAYSGLPPASDLEETLLESAKEALNHHEANRYLLLSAEGLQVMTFHGFCYALVKRAPLEAGVPPESMVIDEEEQETVLEESIREMIHDLVSMPEPTPERTAFENRLLRLNNRLPALMDEIKDLVRRRDLFSDLVEALRTYPNIDEFGEVLTERVGGVVGGFLKEASEAFDATFLCQNWDPFQRHLKEKGAPSADILPEHVPGTAWGDLSAWKSMAEVLTTKDGRPRQQTGPKMGGLYKGFAKGPWGQQVRGLPIGVTRLLSNLKDLPGPDVSLTDIDAVADLIILVACAITMYERKCRQQHVLDFVGLEQAALRILGEHAPSDLQLFLDHRLQQILVDEFQDTSRSQWTLLQRLCAGWTPGDGRTLFLVGDPKQSVYGFRKAEVRLFLEAKQGIPVSGQGLLPVTNVRLEANFRSQATLITWTNEFFRRTVMANPKAAFDEVPFQPSTAHPQPVRPDNPESPPVSLNIFFEDSAVPSPAEAEAQWLARNVLSVAERSLGASIGILLFTRNRLPLYLNALRKIGQAVRVKEGLKVAEQPEVMHLYQMATALCRPHDDLAWASLVRSPWAWVDSGLLLKIAHMPPAAWSHKFKLSAKQYPEIARIKDAVNLGRRRVGRDPLADVVRDVWMALDGPARVAARFGAEGVANCRLFIEVLESIEAGIPEETLSRLDLALETLYAPESPDAIGAPVDLMTVHAAKGLEFDVVFLPYLDWRPLAVSQPPPYLLERSSEPPGLPLIAMGPDRRTGEPEPIYPVLRRLANGRRMGEVKRVLYVGITRARRTLFLSGIAKHTKDGLNGPKDSPLAWVLTDTTDHDDKRISTFLNPLVDPVGREKGQQAQPLPPPVPFQAQPLPYLIETPSELADAAAYEEDAEKGHAEPAAYAAIRGTITHRLIETLWQDGALPKTERIATAIAAEGIHPETATAVAQGIADEVTACQKEPFFQWLLDRARPDGESEYAIEAMKHPGTVQAGILDFVRKDEDRWWIVDFKTSRPVAGQAEVEFVEQQVEYYRPQLLAYQSMLAKAKGIDIAKIRTGLYFTSIQLWHEIT
jgi:ATP-dependent exoDNAse (exonuclease V) beta subunit